MITRRAYVGFCIVVAMMLLALYLTQPASEPRRLAPTPVDVPTPALAPAMEPV
mgnify:CR=1 FL=1|jgi:hypothetical protein